MYEKEIGLENENENKKEKKQHAKELKKIKNFLEGLKKYLEKVYYKPIKTMDAFNNNYIEYESRGVKDKYLSIVDYLNIIRPFLRNLINNHKTHGKWKIQLIMQINFISLETGEICTMHSKSDNVEIMTDVETDDIINELFESFLTRYREVLETKMREGSNFVFESVNLLYYSLHKISLNKVDHI